MNCILSNKNFDSEMCRYCSKGTQICLQEFQTENKKLRKALEFYADVDKYCLNYPDTEIVYDVGKTAREVLQEEK